MASATDAEAPAAESAPELAAARKPSRIEVDEAHREVFLAASLVV
jgi:hypothetical protein